MEDDNNNTINPTLEAFLNATKRQKSKFKESLLNILFSYNKRPALMTIIKFIFGLLIIAIPTIIFFFLIYVISPTPTRYLILPYIIAFALCISILFILLIVKTDINCERTGILMFSWERMGIFNIISCIIFNCFLVATLMNFEQICIIFPIFQGNIAQMAKKEASFKELTQGSYIFRILFISFFWNSEYKYLGYFDITKGFPNQFKTNLQMFITNILITAIYYLLKIIFIKSKNTIAYMIICIVTIYECFFFMFYPIDDDFNYLESNAFYKYSKYYEIIPLFFLLSALIWIALKNHIFALVKKKLFASPSRRRDILTIIIVFISFSSILIGIGSMMYIFVQLLFNDIKRK